MSTYIVLIKMTEQGIKLASLRVFYVPSFTFDT
jgi:hypothetical protein